MHWSKECRETEPKTPRETKQGYAVKHTPRRPAPSPINEREGERGSCHSRSINETQRQRTETEKRRKKRRKWTRFLGQPITNQRCQGRIFIIFLSRCSRQLSISVIDIEKWKSKWFSMECRVKVLFPTIIFKRVFCRSWFSEWLRDLQLWRLGRAK